MSNGVIALAANRLLQGHRWRRAGAQMQSSAEEGVQAGAAREALRDALVAARRGLPDVAVDAGVRASPRRQEDWRRLVQHAADPQARHPHHCRAFRTPLPTHQPHHWELAWIRHARKGTLLVRNYFFWLPDER